MAWIKRTFISLLVIVLLLAGAVAWLLVGLDVNRYKPQLEQLAAEQGVALKLDGDIGWQLWPNIALRLDGVQLAPLSLSDQPLVRAESISIGVALIPLLKKRVEAQEITLLGPQIDISVDEQGRHNWELLTDAMETQKELQAEEPPKLAPPREGTAGEDLQFALQNLRIKNGRIRYRDASNNTKYAVEQLRVAAENLASGEPGKVSANAQISGSTLAQPVQLDIHSSLSLDEDFNVLRLQPLQVGLSSGEAAAEIQLRGNLSRASADKPWQIQLQAKAVAEPLRPWLAVTGTDLVTQSGAALKKFILETNIEGTDKKLDLTPLQLQLDDTSFTGSAQLRNAAIPGLDLALRGGTLVLDDYLPPPSEEERPAEEAEIPAMPIPLPLTAMRGFTANLDLSLEQLKAIDLQLEQPQIQLTVDNGLYQLHKLAADFYGGQLSSNGRFNARGESARAELNGGLTMVEISKVQQALFPDERITFSGRADLTWAAQTSGGDITQLQKNLHGTMQISSNQLALAPFNLEKGMCQLVSYAEKSELPEREWSESTRLQDLLANIVIEGDKVTVKEVLTGVENIAMAGDGKIDLDKGKFDFALGLSLVGERTSADGCTVRNERWRNRPLPLRCKDSFADAGATSCKPDSRRLDDLLRDELKYKVEKKYGEKLEEKVDDLKSKFKDLFKRD
ncbi:AsmA family protein [Microbulbifer pacificus]|uniref:AsmA family protein n=1 Tax=Microbulbifer pacificus TaxID=407164 RepID=UPI000CF54D96|nr:AsmA family protein [Microbulbifer pacificus]